MARITRTDLDNTFRAYCACASDAGFDTKDWALVHGSPTYGQSYKIVVIMEGSGYGSHPLVGSAGHIGTTAREAYDFLRAQTRVLILTRALGA